MTVVRFYHAGCSVCLSAEQALLTLLSPDVDVEVIHLGEQPERVAEAEQSGVQSVPALVMDNNVLHINFGASLDALK